MIRLMINIDLLTTDIIVSTWFSYSSVYFNCSLTPFSNYNLSLLFLRNLIFMFLDNLENYINWFQNIVYVFKFEKMLFFCDIHYHTYTLSRLLWWKVQTPINKASWVALYLKSHPCNARNLHPCSSPEYYCLPFSKHPD